MILSQFLPLGIVVIYVLYIYCLFYPQELNLLKDATSPPDSTFR